MQETFSRFKTNIFIVRFWEVGSVTNPEWYGRIEHIHSKQETTFQDFKGMWTFIQNFGIMLDGVENSGKFLL